MISQWLCLTSASWVIGCWLLPGFQLGARMGTGGQHFHGQELAQAPATSAAWLGGAGSRPVPGGKGTR